MFGWYSKQQEDNIIQKNNLNNTNLASAFIYIDINDHKVKVTEVTNIINKKIVFCDSIYIGELKTFVEHT